MFLEKHRLGDLPDLITLLSDRGLYLRCIDLRCIHRQLGCPDGYVSHLDTIEIFQCTSNCMHAVLAAHSVYLEFHPSNHGSGYLNRLSRRLFVTTDTLDMAIAADANIGLRRIPQTG